MDFPPLNSLQLSISRDSRLLGKKERGKKKKEKKFSEPMDNSTTTL